MNDVYLTKGSGFRNLHRAMRLLGILLMLAGASVAALAQTNAPGVRKLSLEDCIQSALEKNLDLRIARYEPPMALTDLQAAYAGYNPNFTFGGAHNYSKSGGGFNPTIGISSAATTSRRKHFQQRLGRINALGVELQPARQYLRELREGWPEARPLPLISSSGSASISLSQPLLKNFWIDQTRFNIKVAKNRVKYSELG